MGSAGAAGLRRNDGGRFGCALTGSTPSIISSRYGVADARTRRISSAKSHRSIAVSNSVARVTRRQSLERALAPLRIFFAIVRIEC
jgi:hypothetical protein